MSGGVLSDMLRAVRLRGAVFYSIEAAEPWVAEAPATCEILPVIMPGVEQITECQVIAEGSCWAAIVGEPPVQLEQGDVILFPQGDSHVWVSVFLRSAVDESNRRRPGGEAVHESRPPVGRVAPLVPVRACPNVA